MNWKRRLNIIAVFGFLLLAGSFFLPWMDLETPVSNISSDAELVGQEQIPSGVSSPLDKYLPAEHMTLADLLVKAVALILFPLCGLLGLAFEVSTLNRDYGPRKLLYVVSLLPVVFITAWLIVFHGGDWGPLSNLGFGPFAAAAGAAVTLVGAFNAPKPETA